MQLVRDELALAEANMLMLLTHTLEHVHTNLRQYVATPAVGTAVDTLRDVSDRWQPVACPSILSALPAVHDGGRGGGHRCGQ